MNSRGERLQYVREKILKLKKQDDLAIALGIHQTTISLWEKNERKPKGQYVDKIINMCNEIGFNISKVWLEDGVGEMKLTFAPTKMTFTHVSSQEEKDQYIKNIEEENTKLKAEASRLKDELIEVYKKILSK